MTASDPEQHGDGPSPDAQVADDGAAGPPEQRLINTLRDLLRKHKGDSRYLKGILNDLKGTDTKPPRAAEWTSANLIYFLKTHFSEEMAEIVKPRKKKPEQKKPPKTEALKRPRAETAKRDEPKEVPRPTLPREIIALPEQEPPFRKDLKNTKPGSYRVPQTLYDLVEEKVKRDGRRTGGDVASLVKVLLWLYVGAPEEFVEPKYKPE